MFYQSILVNLDIERPVEPITEAAVDLASRSGARLIGLCAAGTLAAGAGVSFKIGGESDGECHGSKWYHFESLGGQVGAIRLVASTDAGSGFESDFLGETALSG